MATNQADPSPSHDNQGNQAGGASASTPSPDAAPEPGERPDWGGRQHIDKSFDPTADSPDPLPSRARMVESDHGTEYASWVSAQLQREYDRRDSVNSRAGAAVTSATGLVTVVLAIVAFARGDKYLGSGGILAAVLAAVLLLLGSAVAAVVAGLPSGYAVLDAASLNQMLTTHWVDSEVRARKTPLLQP